MSERSRAFESPTASKRRRRAATDRPNTWRGIPIREIPLSGYARISDNDDLRNTDNVDRQERIGLTISDGEGLNLVGKWVKDNDRSASNLRKREREGFEHMFDQLAAGEIGGVIVSRFDRLLRDPADLERLIRLGNRHGSLYVFFYDGPDVERLNLGTSGGQKRARQLASDAADESKKTSERITSARTDFRALGLTGCGSSAFGWLGKRHSTPEKPVLKSDGMTPHPGEAKEIRDAVRHFLDDGWTLTQITNDWNARKVPTPRGAPSWDAARVRDILGNERHAGFLEVEVELGKWELRKAAWHANAIISEHDYKRVIAKMRSRRGNVPGPKRMLTSLVRCTTCEGVMSAHTCGQQRYWRCLPRAGRDNCGEAAIRAELVEHGVTEWLLARLAGKPLKGAKRARKAKAMNAHDELAEAQRRFDAVLLRYNAGRMSDEAFDVAEREFDQRRAELEAVAVGVDRTSEQARYLADGDRIIAEWDDWSEPDRRALAQAFIETIWVAPREGARHTGPGGEPEQEAMDRVRVVRRAPVD